MGEIGVVLWGALGVLGLVAAAAALLLRRPRGGSDERLGVDEALPRKVLMEALRRMPPADRAVLQAAIDDGRTIEAIQILRNATGLDLRTAKTAVDQLVRQKRGR